MKKFTVGIAVVCSILFMCCKKYKVEKPVYDPSEATHEKIDKRALPLSGKFKGIITIKSGDTTITWQKFALRYQESGTCN